MSTSYLADFVVDPETDVDLAALTGLAVTIPALRTTTSATTSGTTIVRISFTAADNYTARTYALLAHEALPPRVRSARIRQGRPPFAGPWFDLLED